MNEAKQLVICGIGGRMGHSLRQLAAARPDVRVSGGIGREPGERDGAPVVTMADAAAVIGSADVVIDFSSADGTAALLQLHRDALQGRALVIGTTGLSAATNLALGELAEHAPVLQAANFSIGVNLLLVLAERAAATLDAERYDAEIVEAHHSRKVDAPSGTALALGQAIAEGRSSQLAALRRDGRSGHTGERPPGEIGLHAVRGGNVVGEHRVLFLGERERLELKHEALDRALFAEGALAAAVWLAGRKPGPYEMRDVLGL